MSNPNDLFQGIQADLASIKSKITQLRGLDLSERERTVTDHISNAVAAFDSIEVFQVKREPSTEQSRLDAAIRERQQISYS